VAAVGGHWVAFPGGWTGRVIGYFWVNVGIAISEVPADRRDADAFYDPDPLEPWRIPRTWDGFPPDAAGFDPDFFRISL
jgi:phthiocerol/phenolphthiocerol synthesis type-I polyketide synthase B